MLNTVPMLIAFIILRRRIMESVALTGLKGSGAAPAGLETTNRPQGAAAMPRSPGGPVG